MYEAFDATSWGDMTQFGASRPGRGAGWVGWGRGGDLRLGKGCVSRFAVPMSNARCGACARVTEADQCARLFPGSHVDRRGLITDCRYRNHSASTAAGAARARTTCSGIVRE